MIKDEIIGGLTNAMEHGSTLEQAVQSFINAGYNSQEVRVVAQQLSSGVSTMLPDLNKQNENIIQDNSIPQAPKQVLQNSSINVNQDKKKSASKGMIVTLIIMLIIIIVATILTLIFGQDLIKQYLP